MIDEGTAALLLLPALAVAAGANLPVLLLLPALLALAPAAFPLAPAMAPLASPVTGGLGAILLTAEIALRRIPLARGAWAAFLAPASLAASVAVAFVLLEGRPARALVPAGLVAAGLAAVPQWARLGARLLDAAAPDEGRRRSDALREASSAVSAALLVAVATVRPAAGALLAGLVLLAIFVGGRAALRAGAFLPILLHGLLRHLDGASGWRTAERLPRWLPGDRSRPGRRGARAALVSVAGIGGFRGGWLLRDGEAPLFIYRTAFRVWEVSLREAGPPVSDPRSWAWTVRLGAAEDGPPVLLLPRDGPNPEGGLGIASRPNGTFDSDSACR